jgi:hypothetical protein
MTLKSPQYRGDHITDPSGKALNFSPLTMLLAVFVFVDILCQF